MKSILFMLLIGSLCVLVGRKIAETPSAQVSSVLVNRAPLDSDTLSFNSQGVLSIVEGEIRWSRHKTMPYRKLLAMAAPHQPLPVVHGEIWPTAWVRDEVIDPSPSSHKPIPFRASLRRTGNVLKQWPLRSQQGVYSLQLTEIWSLARPGDELVVEPVIKLRPAAPPGQAKRVLKLEKVDRPVPMGGC